MKKIKLNKKTYLKIAGTILVIDGVASIIYYRKAADWLPHLGRVARSLIGLSLLFV